LEVYGLGPDAPVVRFFVGGKEHALRLGRKTPIGANHYAGADDGATVYTIASFKTTGFEKPLDDLRERRPLRFERGDVSRIEASWHGGGVVLEKRDGRWQLLQPLAGEADDDNVETLLSDLLFLRAAGFVDDPPPDREVGLDSPQYHVVLSGRPPEEGKPAPRWELAIGGVTRANARAGRAGERALYEIPEDRFQKLPKTLEAFRFKDLAKYVASDAAGFELVFHDPGAAEQGASGVVTITGQRSDDGWTTTPEAMAAGSAARVVAELAHLRAVGIAADAVGEKELAGLGLAPPRAAIRVLGEKKPEGGEAPVLADVQLGVQKGDRIIARRADRDTIFQLDAALAEQIPVNLEAFRNRFLTQEEPADEGAVEDGEMAPEGADLDLGEPETGDLAPPPR
jgi:hypothetical protein